MSQPLDRPVVTLSRGLRLLDVTMIGVGAMIGAGIFGLTGIAAGHAGPVGLLLAFFLNGIVTSFTGLTYAELGAAIPEAGGGYLWVREGLSRFWGFFAGWISWFSHSVACSLYAVIFGTFFVELLKLAGVHFAETPLWLGFSAEQWIARLFAVLAVVVFVYINVRGSSETGAVGNVITTFKIVVLLSLALFGIVAMLKDGSWTHNFLTDPSPLPNGLGGVIAAMGLTFVAFEGYEIIAQSGEELVNPERNLPRAIFYSIAIAVGIYLLVGFGAVGALVQDSGLPNWMYLGREGERAMIFTARAIMPYGALVMILGGLASTTSALNATVYSSSRVSFAMGRGGDLPALFSAIHPQKRTPHVAIYISGALIIFMALALPVEDVASGASLTFLVLFLLTNFSLIRLRKTHPDLHRPFKVPFVPWLPLATILVQGVLAYELFSVSWIAWAATILWVLAGLLLYARWGGQVEAAKMADTILLEETIASREYSVLLPLANPAQARRLSHLAAVLAKQQNGEVFALHVERVPTQIGLGDGRALLKAGREIFEEAIEIGQQYNVPVRTQLRLGRNIAQSIISAAHERKANLILMGWPAHQRNVSVAFGNIIDVIATHPPCDLAVVRLHSKITGIPHRILVPVSDGPNMLLSLSLALAQVQFMAQQISDEEERAQLKVTVLHLMHENGAAIAARRRELESILDMDNPFIDLQIALAEDVAAAILEFSQGYDQIVIGASEDRLLNQRLFGSVSQEVAEKAEMDVIFVRRYNPLRYGVWRWLKRI
ncbi:MAG: amino acid transporter [Anaerolineales bacterium]